MFWADEEDPTWKKIVTSQLILPAITVKCWIDICKFYIFIYTYSSTFHAPTPHSPCIYPCFLPHSLVHPLTLKQNTLHRIMFFLSFLCYWCEKKRRKTNIYIYIYSLYTSTLLTTKYIPKFYFRLLLVTGEKGQPLGGSSVAKSCKSYSWILVMSTKWSRSPHHNTQPHSQDLTPPFWCR